MSTRKRLRAGDILELRLDPRLAYIQYAGRHDFYGESIRVLPGVWKVRPEKIEACAGPGGYFIFYPVSHALKLGLVEWVGFRELDEDTKLPAVFRRKGAVTPEGAIRSWIIDDGKTETVRFELSEHERKLPLGHAWNHEMLVDRIAEAWDPSRET